jgi:hypothetical protein
MSDQLNVSRRVFNINVWTFKAESFSALHYKPSWRCIWIFA